MDMDMHAGDMGTQAAADTGGMDMDMDMSSAGNTSMPMMMMMAVFQMDMRTPLYSTGWTPQDARGYAGTCIFLIVLAALLRGLIAAKYFAEQKWLDKELQRRYVVVNGKQPLAQKVSTDSLTKKLTLTENGVEEDVMVLEKRHTHLRPWRFSVDPLRAVMDTVIAGIGYLL